MAKSKPLTTKDLVLIFGVTPMTILNWRKPGEGSRKKPLPFTTRGVSVEFSPIRVKAWANSHGLPMVHDPLDVAEGTHLTKAKPGPKPKVIDRAAEKKRDADRINGKHAARAVKKATVRTATWKKVMDREVRKRAEEKSKARVH